jgi:hypothetical protein
MVEREHGKDIFRWRDFVDIDVLAEAVEEMAAGQPTGAPDNANTRAILADVLDGEGRSALFELIEALAHQHRRNPTAAAASAALGVGDLRNFYGRVYASANLLDPEVQRLLTVLVQFAFFGPARQPGAIDFTHHLLADYLAGRYAVRLLRGVIRHSPTAGLAATGSRPADTTRLINAFRQAIGTAPFTAGSLFHRCIAREMTRDAALKASVLSLAGLDPGRPNVAAALKALAG